MKNADIPAMPSGEKWRETVGGYSRDMSKSPLHNGLTKREMFAMHAMQGLLTCTMDTDCTIPELCADAVMAADALLAELEKPRD